MMKTTTTAQMMTATATAAATLALLWASSLTSASMALDDDNGRGTGKDKSLLTRHFVVVATISWWFGHGNSANEKRQLVRSYFATFFGRRELRRQHPIWEPFSLDRMRVTTSGDSYPSPLKLEKERERNGRVCFVPALLSHSRRNVAPKGRF